MSENQSCTQWGTHEILAAPIGREKKILQKQTTELWEYRDHLAENGKRRTICREGKEINVRTFRSKFSWEKSAKLLRHFSWDLSRLKLTKKQSECVIYSQRCYICTYQTVHSCQCVIGIIEGIGQLVHPIIGFTVSIETNSHGNTEKSQGEKLQLVVIIRPSWNMHMQKSAEGFPQIWNTIQICHSQSFTLLHDFY